MTVYQKIKILLFPLLISGIALLSLNSCSSLKKNKGTAEIIPSISIDKSASQAIASKEFTSGTFPEQKWWEMFADPALNNLIEKALLNSPSLMAAKARVTLAQQNALKIGSKRLPELNTHFDTNYQHLSKDDLLRYPPSKVPAVINDINLALEFKYEFDFWGKNQKAFQAALGKASAEIAEKEQARLILVTSLVQSYLNYEKYLRQLELKQNFEDALSQRLKLIRQRFENGVDTKMQIDDEVIKLGQIEQEIKQLKTSMEIVKNQMKYLIGEGPDSTLEIELSNLSLNQPIPLPTNLTLDLLARRPDLMSLIWNVEAAASEIGVAKAAFYPNIDLTALIGLQSLHWNNLFTINSYRALLNPAIHLPLYTGGKLKANLLGKWAEYDIAIEKYNDALLFATKEVCNQLKVLESLSNQITIEQTRLSAEMDRMELFESRYQEGVGNYLEVLEAKERLISLQLEDTSLEFNRMSEIVHLMKALGGGYHHE